MYESETAERLSQPGVAVGLAWTVLGGEIMFVEATKMEGDGKLTLTGQLGDIMKESASLALNWVRSHANEVRELLCVSCFLFCIAFICYSLEFLHVYHHTRLRFSKLYLMVFI